MGLPLFVSLFLLIAFRSLLVLASIKTALRTSQQLSDDYEPSQYVEPLIGSLNGGHVFVGSSTPFGSVKVVADSDTTEDAQPGYVSNNAPIFSISQTHDDGTGGSFSLGHFGLLPQLCSYSSTIAGVEGKCELERHKRAAPIVTDSARAAPGFFSLSLASGIDIRLTSTDHTALHSYTFPLHPHYSRRDNITLHKPVSYTRGPTLLIDLTTDLQGSFRGAGKLDINLNNISGVALVTGSGRFQPSFGEGSFLIHMCTYVNRVKRIGIYSDGKLQNGLMKASLDYTRGGVLVEVDERKLSERGNILQTMVGEQEAFERVRLSSRARWNKVMSSTFKPSLKGVSLDRRISLFSALYRAYLAPYNVTGDNPMWESKEPYWDSFYCIWDSFRTTSPLMSVMHPDTQAEQVRALIDIYRHLGYLPDCRMSNCKGLTQGGSNADTLLADTFVKGISKGIDWHTGLEAMIKDAEVSPPDWGLEGRGGIKARKELGYVPQEGRGDDPPGPRVVIGRSASRTLEYSVNDHSIALVAAGLNKTDLYNDYIRRSGDWYNLWNPNRKFEHITGFINARFENGSFSLVEDVRKCSSAFEFGKCYLMYTNQNAQFYEGSAYEYSFYVPHDMAKLVKLMGGDAAFIHRLDLGWDREYIDIGDEMGFMPNFQYNYAEGGYRHTVDRSLATLHRYFNNSLGGIAGNDDSGAMGAYVIFTALGMFPVAGSAVYLLSTPMLPSYSIRSEVTGYTATLTTEGFDGAGANKYIQRATLNGDPFTRNWISHEEFFLSGGKLHLVLGRTPTAFGNKTADLPPSLSTGGFRERAAMGI